MALAVALVVPALSAPLSFAQTVDIEAGRRIVENLSLADWMGPLAPIALSPFFGLACLSAAALLVERGWLPPQALLSHNPALQNETVFVILLILALFTSLPRLTKVTKPIAQLADLLETYAGIVFLLIVFWAARAEPSSPAGGLTHAGLLDVGSGLFIALVTATNVLAIQTIRLFFETLIWLSPIPLIDAVFETANKLICAGLVAIYIFSPAVALAINLALFVLCALFARAAYRRLKAFRNDLLIPAARRIRERFF